MSRRYEDMFRPVYELYGAIGWVFAGTVVLLFRPPYWPMLLLGIVGLAWFRWTQAATIYRFRISISAFRIGKLSIPAFFSVLRDAQAKKSIFVGYGFKWEQRHSEISRHILNRNTVELGDGPPTWIPERIRQSLMPPDTVLVRDGAIGVPWIHGLDPEEAPINLNIDALSGGTLIVGTTRAGKTRLYECITAQVIHSGAPMIVIDPKGDADWQKRLEWECKRAGRRFLLLDPAKPSKSIRMNVLANWNNISETATRLSQLVDADGSFAAFAWKTLYNINRGIFRTGAKPTIALAKQYVQRGIAPLLEQLLREHYLKLDGPGWDRDLADMLASVASDKRGQGKDFTPLTALKLKYTEDKRSKIAMDETIEALIAMDNHSKEHYTKMIQVLEPLLEMLGSDELGKLLSPDLNDLTDTRPIWDNAKIIADGCVLFAKLDSLSNSIIGSALGSVLLADLASVAGAMYNAGEKRNVYLFIDEAAEVVNDQAIQILNKAGGAGFKSFLACQTIADFEARFGTTAKAKQALGNLNNIIALRIKDFATAQWIAESFGTTEVRREEVSYSTGSESSASFTEFRGSTSRSLRSTEGALVDPVLLTKLPPMNYFAYLAGSTIYKGRVPLIEEDWK